MAIQKKVLKVGSTKTTQKPKGKKLAAMKEVPTQKMSLKGLKIGIGGGGPGIPPQS